jgi:hypothetical protein
MLIPDHETVVDFLNYEAIAGTAIEFVRPSLMLGDWRSESGNPPLRN